MQCTELTPPGFSGGSVLKNPLANARDAGPIPGLGRSPEEGNDYPFQCSGLDNSMDYTVHAVALDNSMDYTVHAVAKNRT